VITLPVLSLRIDEGDLLIIWASAIVFGFVFRAAGRTLWRRLMPPERIFIVGHGPLAEAVVRKLALFPDIHAEVADTLENFGALRERLDDLDDIDRIVVASSDLNEELLGELLPVCRSRSVKLTVVPPTRGMFGTATHLGHVAELPLLDYNTWDISGFTLAVKRAGDVVLSAVALFVLSPLFVLAAIAIFVTDGLPVLFRQPRAGEGGQPFTMLKFRTMVKNAEALLPGLVPFDKLDDPMFKLKADPRVTRVGRLLRRTSLDELPQLVNVLVGDMSIVGPRPEQFDLVERYRPEHRFRLDVKPGITGPMQVYGRGELTFEERLAVEREYVENLSFARDVKIVLMTLPAVFARRGAY
jgi:exopolysaccharide biosynthesis polyprenyl glycosylphosphotransferase